MYEIEYTEVRAGQRETFVRRFADKSQADDFYNAMRRAGTRPDSIQKNYR